MALPVLFVSRAYSPLMLALVFRSTPAALYWIRVNWIEPTAGVVDGGVVGGFVGEVVGGVVGLVVGGVPPPVPPTLTACVYVLLVIRFSAEAYAALPVSAITAR